MNDSSANWAVRVNEIRVTVHPDKSSGVRWSWAVPANAAWSEKSTPGAGMRTILLWERSQTVHTEDPQ
ncbi:hypothetical protein GCM10009634_41960 [Saccharothrix xinjiangensis]